MFLVVIRQSPRFSGLQLRVLVSAFRSMFRWSVRSLRHSSKGVKCLLVDGLSSTVTCLLKKKTLSEDQNSKMFGSQGEPVWVVTLSFALGVKMISHCVAVCGLVAVFTLPVDSRQPTDPVHKARLWLTPWLLSLPLPLTAPLTERGETAVPSLPPQEPLSSVTLWKC